MKILKFTRGTGNQRVLDTKKKTINFYKGNQMDEEFYDNEPPHLNPPAEERKNNYKEGQI